MKLNHTLNLIEKTFLVPMGQQLDIVVGYDR